MEDATGSAYEDCLLAVGDYVYFTNYEDNKLFFGTDSDYPTGEWLYSKMAKLYHKVAPDLVADRVPAFKSLVDKRVLKEVNITSQTAERKNRIYCKQLMRKLKEKHWHLKKFQLLSQRVRQLLIIMQKK